MSGSGTLTASAIYSGYVNADSLIFGIKWAGSTISYSNPNAVSDYQNPYLYSPQPSITDNNGNGIYVLADGFGQIGAGQWAAVQFALDTARYGSLSPGGAGFSVEGFTNLQINAAASGSGAGTIRVAGSADPLNGAYAGVPSPGSIYSGDVFVDPAVISANPAPGDYAWWVMLHELGHALGLKHSYETSQYNSLSMQQGGDYSVMAGVFYAEYNMPQTYMQDDILALQTLYGADFTTNSGATTYTWDPTNGTSYVNGAVALDPTQNVIFSTIWDGGGVDVYDLSNYTTDLNITITPGEWSTFDYSQVADFGFGGSAQGNVANALLYNNDTRSLIENAYGGSGNDWIHGNNTNNLIKGNNGNDQLFGYLGVDTLQGGNGDDILFGGDGLDTLTGGAGSDQFRYSGIDVVTDFEPGMDKFVLISYALAGLSVGSLPTSAFRIGSSALDADDRIIYNSSTGALFHDPDGNGASAAQQIASLGAGLALTANDFSIPI